GIATCRAEVSFSAGERNVLRFLTPEPGSGPYPPRTRCRSVAWLLLRRAAGGGRAGAGVVDPADAVVVAVGDVEAAGGVEGQAPGCVELGAGGRAAVTAVTGGAVPGHGGDRAAAVDPPDALVAGVGDVHVARGGDDHRLRVLEEGG